MRILAKEKISAHRYKTPEGYLVCVDAILARTGKQQYRHNELFSDSSKDDIVDVDRPYEEVFNEKTIASFENKPFVNEHPHEDVNVYNHRDYAVGFVRDVHEGQVDGEPVLLGNIIVTDEEAIADIESGNKLELSCGYDCDIADEENLCQRNIRGNHVALCKAGRAGIARIIDSKVEDSKVYIVYGEESGYMKEFKTLPEARKFIKETEKFDKRNGIEDQYYIETEVRDSVEDSIEDADERLYPELKKIAEEYNLAKKGQSNSKTTNSDLRYINKKHEVASDLRNKLLKEWNSVVNTLSKTYQLILGKEPSLIKVEEFKKMLKGEKHKNDSMEEIVKDKLENKQVKVRIKFDSNKEANDALKMLHRKEDFIDSDLIFDDTVEVLTTDVLVDTLKKALKMYFIKNIKVIDSEEIMEDGRLIEPEEKYVKEFERMIQKIGFKIVSTGKTLLGRSHYQVITNQKGYDDSDLKQFSKELGKIANTMRNWEIPMTYNVGLQYDTYISAGIDLDKQWVNDSIEDSQVEDEAIYMYIADPDDTDDKEIIDRAKSNGLKLEKSGGLTKVIGDLSQLAKALKMLKEDVVAYSKQPRSIIKKVKDSTETTKSLDTVKLINIIKATKSTKDSCKDDMELSAKTSEELDNLMKQYQKKHHDWKFGEIKKDKGLYRCSVVKDSKVKDGKKYTITFALNGSSKETKDFNTLEEFDRYLSKNQIGWDYVWIYSIVSNTGYEHKEIKAKKWTDVRQKVYKTVLMLDSKVK